MKTRLSLCHLLATISILLLSLPVWAAVSPEVAGLQKGWAEARYQLPEAQREAAYEVLSQSAQKLVTEQPENAEAFIWQGIILSTYAGEASGLSALKLVKQAREALEKAINLDASAMSGSAYTSLGALYYQVPGWPVSFGSDKKARKNLLKGLKLNPKGIDSNFFYADFLISEKEYADAGKSLEMALNAAPRPGREIADAGRRGEIQDQLVNSPLCNQAACFGAFLV
jgi:tetratricopeptide (TPR) repeat protein